MKLPRGLMRYALVLLGVALVGGVGCRPTMRFDAGVRAACFDRLFDALRRGHLAESVEPRLAELRSEYRSRVIHSTTRREYLVELAGMLAEFQDPHITFDNLREYWETTTGNRLSPVAAYCWLCGGHCWVQFKPGALTGPNSAPANTGLEPVYELLAVEGIPAAMVAWGLLNVEPDQSVEVQLRGAGGEIRAVRARRPPPPPKCDEEQLALALAKEGYRLGSTKPVDTKIAVVNRLADDIGYIRFEHFDDQAVVSALGKALDELGDTRALILDLRSNRGGLYDFARDTLGFFVDPETPFARYHKRQWWWVVFGFIPIDHHLELYATPQEARYSKPIVVLIDTQTASSGEFMAAALRDARGAKLVGARTCGAATGVATVELPDGLKVNFGDRIIIPLTGKSYLNCGLEPDIMVPLDTERVLRDGADELYRWHEQVLQIGLETAKEMAGWGTDSNPRD
ncbi:MAG: hypothetical protein KAV82_05035 [Phycisphaerae bacterium]|nr:hypothetical protein [Phycisphaerae bacterium]